MIITPAQGARNAAAAEQMFAPGMLTPDLPAGMEDWTLLAHLTAQDALFGAELIGAGDRLFYGFIAQAKADENEHIVVFRGTERWDEWLIDGESLLIPTRNGLVAHGFSSIYGSARVCGVSGSAWSRLVTMLPPGSRVTVIGHSLGAALATYLTLDLRRAMNGVDVRGMFYASPKPGNSQFANTFNAEVGAANYDCWNYVRDLVPHMPPLPGYQSLPNTHWIYPNDSTFKIPHELAANHAALNYASLLENLVTVGVPA